MRKWALAVVVVVLAAVFVPHGSPGRRLAHDVRTMECRKGTADHAVVALGDSITRGNSDPAWGFEGDDSWFSLATCHGRVRYGFNAGVYGDTTQQMLDRFGRDVAAHHPRVVVITGGTNDVLQRVPLEVTIRHLRQLADDAQTLGASVTVATIPPISDPQYREPAAAVDAGIRTMAAAAHVRLVDFYGAVQQGGIYRPGWTADGVHPLRPAAQAMAAAFTG